MRDPSACRRGRSGFGDQAESVDLARLACAPPTPRLRVQKLHLRRFSASKTPAHSFAPLAASARLLARPVIHAAPASSWRSPRVSYCREPALRAPFLLPTRSIVHTPLSLSLPAPSVCGTNNWDKYARGNPDDLSAEQREVCWARVERGSSKARCGRPARGWRAARGLCTLAPSQRLTHPPRRALSTLPACRS